MVLIIIIAVVVSSLSPLHAQQPAKLRKIGYLSQSSSPVRANITAFRQGMRDLGYVEGENIILEYRMGERGSRLTELAAELVKQKVELIVAGGPAVIRAKAATEIVPIVFLFSGDPVEAGLIETLARPGRNMTGITWLAFELVGKRLEILKEAIPKVARVAVLASPSHPGEQRELRETQTTAQALGITLLYYQVNDTPDVNAALDAIGKEHVNAILVFPDPITNAHIKQVTDFAMKRRLPSVFGRKEPVEADGLISYGPKIEEVYRRVPVYVDKILKGASPATIPTELPTKFEMFINLQTAQKIGLTIPPNVLARADKVIR